MNLISFYFFKVFSFSDSSQNMQYLQHFDSGWIKHGSRTKMWLGVIPVVVVSVVSVVVVVVAVVAVAAAVVVVVAAIAVATLGKH